MQNRRLVLQEIFTNESVSRADIARSSGLTRATVSDLVAELADDGLLGDAGTGPSAGGKPPILLEINADARHVISLDLSGRLLSGAIVNLRGATIAHLSDPQLVGTGDEAVRNIAAAVAELREAADAALLGVGVGTPGIVDAAGSVIEAANIGWHKRPLARELEDLVELPVHVVNDSRAAALAEYATRPHASNLVVVYAGPGVGAGIILDGRILRGDGYGAGEIGHISIAAEPPCTCGNVGCLEAIASAPSILNSLSDAVPDLPTEPGGAWKRARELSDAGDPATVEVIERAGKALGVALANLVGILDVHDVAIVGEVVAAGPRLIGAAEAELRRRVLPALSEKVTIQAGTELAGLVVRGAAALVIHHELGVA